MTYDPSFDPDYRSQRDRFGDDYLEDAENRRDQERDEECEE